MADPFDHMPDLLAAIRKHGIVEIRRVPPGGQVLPGETLEVCDSHHAHYAAIAWKPLPKEAAPKRRR